jgi:plasmid stability protein
MRTTIRIDDELYRRLKAHATASGRTVAAVIDDTLRAGLARTTETDDAELPSLPTYGGSGLIDGVEPDSNAALREVMDAGEPLDALR